MNVLTKAIVSNSEIIKNYKACREKAESFGKILVFKNNQPDAVLFSITEYERLSTIIEYLESLEEEDMIKAVESFVKGENGKRHSVNIINNDL